MVPSAQVATAGAATAATVPTQGQIFKAHLLPAAVTSTEMVVVTLAIGGEVYRQVDVPVVAETTRTVITLARTLQASRTERRRVQVSDISYKKEVTNGDGKKWKPAIQGAMIVSRVVVDLPV